MAKKIYDILPPGVAHKVENTLKEMGVTKAKSKKRTPAKSRVAKTTKTTKAHVQTAASVAQHHHVITKKASPWRWPAVFGVVLLLIVGVYFYFTLQKAEIAIEPSLQTLSFQDKLTASGTATSLDIAKKIIPTRYVDVQQQGEQSFEATGTAQNDGKATGTIKVYNKVSPSTPIILKEGTHFLSDSGKYFVSLDRITVPAAQKGAIGSISVRVEAEEAGDGYNIKASKFSIPKLSGTAYYYTVWAESTSPMTGGHTGNVKQVTEEDLEKAKSQLTQTLFDQAKASLQSTLGQDEVLIESATTQTVIESSANVKTNAVADSFIQKGKVKIGALVFKKQDLQSFAENQIMAKLPQVGEHKQEFLQNSINLEYTATAVDMQKETATINMSVSVKTYHSIDKEALLGMVTSKSADQVRQQVYGIYGDHVADVKVKFWPFWVRSTPKDTKKITIDLQFDEK